MPDPSNSSAQAAPPPSILERMEDGILERLKQNLPSDFYVSSFPGDTRNFDTAQMNAVALVHYAGSKYGLTSEMDRARQSREARFTILLQLSAKHGGRAGYGILEKVRKALQNVIPADGAAPLQILSEQLTGQDADRWNWQIDISASAPAIADHVLPPSRTIRPVLAGQSSLNRFKQEEA